MTANQDLTLKEAATRFLMSLSPEERQASQAELYKFTRWYGGENTLSALKGPGIASYAERLSLSDTDYTAKLEIVRRFLAHAKKKGWCRNSLASHLKAKKVKSPVQSAAARGVPEAVQLTEQRYSELESELAGLKDKRTQLIKDIQKAAADKDFRENAPLAAAREQRGHVEGQIRELEDILKSATIIDRKVKASRKAGAGDCITLNDLASGEELRYVLVSPKEVDPSQGKISIASPLGKAVTGHQPGDTIVVNAPVGKLRYQIKQVEH